MQITSLSIKILIHSLLPWGVKKLQRECKLFTIVNNFKRKTSKSSGINYRRNMRITLRGWGKVGRSFGCVHTITVVCLYFFSKFMLDSSAGPNYFARPLHRFISRLKSFNSLQTRFKFSRHSLEISILSLLNVDNPNLTLSWARLSSNGSVKNNRLTHPFSVIDGKRGLCIYQMMPRSPPCSKNCREAFFTHTKIHETCWQHCQQHVPVGWQEVSGQTGGLRMTAGSSGREFQSWRSICIFPCLVYLSYV